MHRSNSNWSEKEKDYDKLREEFMKTVNLADYVDHPHLFIKRQMVTGHLTRINLFNMILNVKLYRRNRNFTKNLMYYWKGRLMK